MSPPPWPLLYPSYPPVPVPSASSLTPPTPSSPARPTISHDLSESQPALPSPLPQPEVAGGSRSQRDVLHAPSATWPPPTSPMLPSIRPSLPLDYLTSACAPPLPPSQSAAARIVSRSHAPSAKRLPPSPTVSGQRIVQDLGKEVAPPKSSVAGQAKHAVVQPDARNQSSHAPTAEITSLMTASEVIASLGARGCLNLSDQLDAESCSKYPISNGGYGDIYRAKLKNGTEVAIKTMRLLLNAEGQKHIKHAARELYTWSKCRHKNVQQLLGLVEFRDQIGMVSAWEVNGDLGSYLQRYPETDRYQISAQVAEGLAYLHQSGIAHGDLKGVVSAAGVPLLSDFGNATLHEYTLNFTSTVTKSSLSVRWAAPELIKGAATYSAPADVYALGMEAITGTPPWTGKAELAVIFAVVSQECPQRPLEQIPTDSKPGDMLWSLLKRCWVHEPGGRPSAGEVKDFMQGITQGEMVQARRKGGEPGK
ncbi:hypothetical protein FRC08_015891 [Ceratobasidium sp. 394]|nr:hypothetical protein FRC08_015891 [Ceratobasidium sp. 394]